MEFLVSLNDVIKKAIVFHNIEVKDKSKVEVNRIKKECKEGLKIYCEKLNLAGIKAEPHLGAGETLEEILRISRERNASMIVTGTRDSARLHEILHTTISHRLAKVSELPTLLVP
jgi:nucleotide-binding universal stress UspA family protein